MSTTSHLTGRYQMTWGEAVATQLEHTQLGYTLRSLDRLWAIVTVDDWTDREGPETQLYGNWLWLDSRVTEDGQLISCYDLWDDALIFTRLQAARAHIATLPAPAAEYWHPLNLGDDSRYERAYLEGTPFTPKAGSLDALHLKHRVLRASPDAWLHRAADALALGGIGCGNGRCSCGGCVL